MFDRRVTLGGLELSEPDGEGYRFDGFEEDVEEEFSYVDDLVCARCRCELDDDRFCSACGAVTLASGTWVDGTTKP